MCKTINCGALTQFGATYRNFDIMIINLDVMICIKLSGVVNNGVIVLSFISSSFQSTMSLKARNIPNEIRKNISHQKCESVDTHGNRRPTKLLCDTLGKNGAWVTMGEEKIKKRNVFRFYVRIPPSCIFFLASPFHVRLLPRASLPRVPDPRAPRPHAPHLNLCPIFFQQPQR